MRTQDILMTCGSVISILAATPALPQQGQPGQYEPPRQPGQTTTTQPGQPGRTTSGIGQFNLRDLEGVWRVDVNVNPQIFKVQKSTTSTPTPGMDTGKDKDKDLDRDQPGDPPGQDRTPPGQDRTPPGQDRTPPGQSGGLSSSSTSSFSGFAESDLIFNDRVVRQEIVIPDMKMQGGSGSGMPGGNIGQPSTTTGRSGSDVFRSMTLISFDEQNRKYHIAFLDNQCGEIKHCTGTYDPSQNRIVFNSVASTSGTSTLRTSSGYSLPENVKVVLEVLSPDSHRVTMYQPGSSSSTTPTTPGTRTDPTKPPTDPSKPPSTPPGQAGQPGQPSTVAMGDSEGTVIYRATYNKATGADATKARELLQESDRRTTRLDENPNRDR